MNQKELIATTASNIGMQKNIVSRCFHGLIETIESSLVTEESVMIRGFGTLRVSKRKQRKGVNPATGESLIIPASKHVKLDASRNLLDKIGE